MASMPSARYVSRMVVYSSSGLSLNNSISLLSRVYFGQVMFDNGLVALELLGWLGFSWLMKLTGVVLISGQDRRDKEGRYTYSEHPYRRDHRRNRRSQGDRMREKSRGRGGPSYVSTLDAADSELVPGGRDYSNAGTQTERPNILGGSKLRKCSTMTSVVAVVALDSG